MTRLILMGTARNFPSAVERFGLVATYSGAVPGCLPGLPVSLPQGAISQPVNPLAQAAGRPKPAATIGRLT